MTFSPPMKCRAHLIPDCPECQGKPLKQALKELRAKQVVFKADLGRIIDVNTGAVMALVEPCECFSKSFARRVAKAAVQTLNAEERGKWLAKQRKGTDL